MSDLPPPLTPPDCDLRDFSRMMLDITRLRQSSFDSIVDDAAWRAGFNLWFSAWHSVPAGSLENTDAALAKAAGLGRDVRTWGAVKADALRGFVECSDGRLYHDTVSEFALEAWIEKLIQRISSGAGNAKRWGVEFDASAIEEALSHSAALLANLAPNSKFLSRLRRKRPGGKAKPSHPDQEALPLGPENVPVGSQGTGTGTGTGIIEKHPLPPREPEAPIDDDDGGKPDDLVARANRFARLGGVNLNSAYPKPFDRELDFVRAWTTDAIPDALIEETIKRKLDQLKEGDSVSTFRFYDGAIRAAFARKRPKSSGPMEQRRAIRVNDGTDTRIPEMRKRLRERVGARSYDNWLGTNVSLRVNGSGLVLTATSDFIASHVEANYGDVIRAEAVSLFGMDSIAYRAEPQ